MVNPLDYANQLMGLEKGAKWRKDKVGEVTFPSPGISAPVDATHGSAASVVPVVYQSEHIDFNLHYVRGIGNQAQVFEQTPRSANDAFGQGTFMDHRSQLTTHSLLPQTTVLRQPRYNSFGGFEVAEGVSNFDLPEGVVPNLAERSRGAYPTISEVNIHLEALFANDSGLSIQDDSTHFDPNVQDGPLRDDINTPQFFDEDGSIPVDLFLLHNSVFPSFMPPTHSNDTSDAVAEQVEGQPAKRHRRGQPGEQSVNSILRGHTARGPTRRKSTSHS
ncbi:hypothetical protein EKO04_011444 [Ascochyta lentis]|uniref:Uncharacterized protein n=1 Tax=Ascochyta lentis TaxID=205686 RepID=A0A8H7ITC8_9PLEO|nr:hypothetical protein EKO04_011444 [Ascochyta lentis]